jgi:hypothetical protein
MAKLHFSCHYLFFQAQPQGIYMSTKDLWGTLMPTRLTHARHDPAICLVPGLFRSLKRGDYEKQKLHLTYEFGPKEKIEFLGFEPLGAEDLRVLQGLIAMSGKTKRVIKPDVKGQRGLALREGLELKGSASNAPVFVVQCSFYELAKEIGHGTNSGGVLKSLKDSIKRLWAVAIVVHSNNNWAGFKILSSLKVDNSSNQLWVALNPRVTEAIFGSRPHARINMDEVRKLGSDPARILHQRLCAIISQGDSRKILPDTLISYIWPDEAVGSTQRWRKMTLKKALTEIVATGAWDIQEGYQITRKGDFKKKLKAKIKKAA